MWLIVSLVAAAIASGAFLLLNDYRRKLKLGLLALMLLGAFLMVLTDHLIAFIKGENFIEVTTDGLISSGTMLGIAMILPILAIWAIAILPRKRMKTGQRAFRH
jgi:hypothetical protein